MPSFPPSAGPPPSPPTPPITPPARYIGAVALNDGDHTVWSGMDTPGTRFLQTEQLSDRDGNIAVVKVDRTKLEMIVRLFYSEKGRTSGISQLIETWQRTLEDYTATAVAFYPGNGGHYPTCLASEIVSTLAGPGAPGYRIFRVSFKVTSQTTSLIVP